MAKIVLTLVFIVALISSAAIAGPGKVRRAPQGVGVDGEFIAVFKDSLPREAVDGLVKSLAMTFGLQVKFVWKDSIRGFSFGASDAQVAALAEDPRIDFIEQNSRGFVAQPSATQWTWLNGEYLWHLDRLDEVSWAGRDSQHNMCTIGGSVYAYVLDLGVRADHVEFGWGFSRVRESVNFSPDLPEGVAFAPDLTNGCAPAGFWHGTAVASILAGSSVGAAKTQVISLRYATCNGVTETDRLVTAINWINSTDNDFRHQPGVINHSGYVPPWWSGAQVLETTIAAVVADLNFPYFTSADNFSTDACHFSPNNIGYTRNRTNGSILVVGGTSASGETANDYRYQRWTGPSTPALGLDSGSNAGPCVGVYAPAVSIYAARNDTASSYSRMNGSIEASGTSFAAPLAAALGARYIEKTTAQTGIRPTAAQVYSFLVHNGVTLPQHVTTPAYYFCANLQNVYGHWADFIPPTGGVCPTGTTGVNGSSTPYFFPAVGNDSAATMLYWDEGVCW
jgi:hypothetical protein